MLLLLLEIRRLGILKMMLMEKVEEEKGSSLTRKTLYMSSPPALGRICSSLRPRRGCFLAMEEASLSRCRKRGALSKCSPRGGVSASTRMRTGPLLWEHFDREPRGVAVPASNSFYSTLQISLLQSMKTDGISN